jgi:hypothetical protein
MLGRAASKMMSGLAIGAVLGATTALILSSRAGAILPQRGGTPGPTPFEPANLMIARAQGFIEEVRLQILAAVEEGRATAAATRQELTERFEAAKRGEGQTGKE